MINIVFGLIGIILSIIEMIIGFNKLKETKHKLIINSGTGFMLSICIMVMDSKEKISENLIFIIFLLLMYIITIITIIVDVINKKKSHIYQKEMNRISNWK